MTSINRKLYLDQNTADFHFLFEKDDAFERVPAHKLILSTGSKVFYTMFYGSIPQDIEVKIVDVTLAAFKEFLQFFYTDIIPLTSENIAQVMNLVRKYGIERCMKQCIDFLKDTLTNEDVCSGYQLAIKFELDDLKRFCERKICANAEEVLKSDDFLNCEKIVLSNIMRMDSLLCEEAKVFDACMDWAKKSCEKKKLDANEMKNLREELDSSLYLIHFQRMKIEEFAPRSAQYKGLFTFEEVIDISQIVASKEYVSKIFTTKPLTYDIFTWDESRVLEVSLSEELQKHRGSVDSTESTKLSSSKPLLLNKIKFARIFKNSHFSMAIEFTLIQNTILGKTLILNQKMYLSDEEDVFAEFPKPVLIHPKLSYEIRLNRQSDSFDTTKLRFGKIVRGDIEINFTRTENIFSSYFGLLSVLYFNQL